MVNNSRKLVIDSTGIFDNLLMSNYGLGSETKIFQYCSLVFLIVEQLLVVYTPLFFKVFSILVLLFLPSRQQSSIQQPRNELSKFNNSNAINEPIVFNNYRNFVDDRNSKRGTISDVKRLKLYGFNKYRHLSNNFVKFLLDDEMPLTNKKSKSKIKT